MKLDEVTQLERNLASFKRQWDGAIQKQDWLRCDVVRDAHQIAVDWLLDAKFDAAEEKVEALHPMDQFWVANA